jgi:segregation and condensation protein B
MRLQAVLFAAPAPATLQQLADATQLPSEAITAGLRQLERDLAHTGLRLSQLDYRYQLVTAPEAAADIRRYLQEEAETELTKPALETLAIVAYRGPLTKAAIDDIRGVASDAMLRNLLARDLITEAGKSSEPGRPTLYAISHTFLQHFGLASLTDLPPIPEPADAD